MKVRNETVRETTGKDMVEIRTSSNRRVGLPYVGFIMRNAWKTPKE